MNNRDIIQFLKQKNVDGAGFVDQLKISYRPIVCPFVDLLNAIPYNQAVFDIGCGSGMFLSLIQEYRSPKKLGGIEIDPQLIQNAQKLLEQGQTSLYLEVFDGKNIPDEIQHYDYIFLIDVFHHIPASQQFSFLEQLFQKMKSGSTLIFKEIEGASILKYWNKFHDLLLAGEIGHEVSSKAIKNFISQFEMLQITKFSKKRMLLYPHYTFEIVKHS